MILFLDLLFNYLFSPSKCKHYDVNINICRPAFHHSPSTNRVWHIVCAQQKLPECVGKVTNTYNFNHSKKLRRGSWVQSQPEQHSKMPITKKENETDFLSEQWDVSHSIELAPWKHHWQEDKSLASLKKKKSHPSHLGLLNCWLWPPCVTDVDIAKDLATWEFWTQSSKVNSTQVFGEFETLPAAWAHVMSDKSLGSEHTAHTLSHISHCVPHITNTAWNPVAQSQALYHMLWTAVLFCTIHTKFSAFIERS